MTPRLFDLSSTWHLPVPPEKVWAIIADINMSWPSWWPRCSFARPLVRTKPVSNSQEDILKATTAHLNFKAAHVFWDDVVNATFLAVPQNKGAEVDLATAAALTRGWNHTRYVASVAQELRSNHPAPRAIRPASLRGEQLGYSH